MAGATDRQGAALELEATGTADPPASGVEAAVLPPLASDELASIRDEIRRITSSLSGLLDRREELLEDVAGAVDLAQAVKPYMDRLASLHRLLDPLERIRENRDQILELQAEIAQDVAVVEDVSAAGEEQMDADLMVELRNEIAAVKRDRKIFVVEGDGEDEEDEESPSEEKTRADAATPLAEQPLTERLRTIFGPRFVDLPRLGNLLGRDFTEEEVSAAAAGLEAVWSSIFDTPNLRPHIEANRVRGLRRTFSDFGLLYRPAQLPGDGHIPVPCSLESLREFFSDRFLGGKGLWYSRLPFYQDPLARGHWALVDHQYLNLTFKKPRMRLILYARANDIPPTLMRQKSCLEDVFDRLVLDAATDRQFFSNCNSVTRSSYQQRGEKAKKQVYVYYKDAHVRISGKRGIPHWRPGRPRWPGVLPAIVFASAD
ncbi:hypothetical protein ACFL6X_00525 [Candidatus Latescibacterota bacterium]